MGQVPELPGQQGSDFSWSQFHVVLDLGKDPLPPFRNAHDRLLTSSTSGLGLGWVCRTRCFT